MGKKILFSILTLLTFNCLIVNASEYIFTAEDGYISLNLEEEKKELKDSDKFKIKFDGFNVVYDSEFLKNQDVNLSFYGAKIEKNDLNIQQKKYFVSNASYYKIDVYNAENILDKYAGSAEVVIDGKNSSYVYYLNDKGVYSKIKSKYNNGKVKFKINKSGIIVLSDEKINNLEYLKSLKNKISKRDLIVLGLIFIIVIIIFFIIGKIRKIRNRRRSA